MSTTESNQSTSRQDRERQRAERGLRSSQSSSARGQTAKPPRRRRPLLALLAVLLIVGGAAVAGLLAVRMDSRTDMVALGQEVGPGEEITVDMLTKVPVNAEGINLIPEDQAEETFGGGGIYSKVPIAEGQLLDTAMLTKENPIDSSNAVVGIPIGGTFPSDLQTGDLLRLVRVGESGEGATSLVTGLVMSLTSTSGDGGLGGGETSSTIAKVVIPAQGAPDVVDAVGNEKIGGALMERGVSIDKADLRVLGDG